MRDTAARQSLRRSIVTGHAAFSIRAAELRDGLTARLQYRDERGDVAPRTVGIAVMAGIALSVGAIIASKLEAKANALNLGE
jgi:hypothetical protein